MRLGYRHREDLRIGPTKQDQEVGARCRYPRRIRQHLARISLQCHWSSSRKGTHQAMAEAQGMSNKRYFTQRSVERHKAESRRPYWQISRCTGGRRPLGSSTTTEANSSENVRS